MGGPQLFYESFKVNDKVRIKYSGEIDKVLYSYYWGGGILVKLVKINNQKENDPVEKCLGKNTGKGEFWQDDLERVL